MGSIYEYYEEMKKLARQKRSAYSLSQIPVGLNLIRDIYKSEGIRITLRDVGLKNIKAAYYNDDDGCDVLLNKKIPKEARIFALVHELKHHYVDRDRLNTTVPCCLAYNQEPLIEKTAEVFAAEFIWPENDFFSSLKTANINKQNCTPEQVVHFKKRHQSMSVSYKFITKRLEWFRVIEKGQYNNIQFKKLEYDIYGVPFYLTRLHKKHQL